MNKFLDFIKRSIIIIFGMFIVFTNIIIGIQVLPEIVKVATNKYTPLIVSLGIMFQGILTIYFIIKYALREEK